MTALINRLLFATDFSDCATRAEAYAVFFAGVYQVPVDILHVLELFPGLDPEYPVTQVYVDQLRKETDAQLAETVRRFQDKQVTVKGRSVLGIPSVQICAAAESHADLIVLGTRGKTGLEHLLLGSTAERVVVKAPCPVVTVCLPASHAIDAASARRSAGVQRILAPVDFSDCSLDALEYAVQIAKQLKAAMTILYVLEPVSYGLDLTLTHASEREHLRTRIEVELRTLNQAIATEGVTVHHTIQHDPPMAGRELGTLDRQDGARGAAQDGFGHAAVHEMRQATATVSSHDHEVALTRLEKMKERIGRRSALNGMMDGHAFRGDGLSQGAQLRLYAGTQVLALGRMGQRQIKAV